MFSWCAPRDWFSRFRRPRSESFFGRLRRLLNRRSRRIYPLPSFWPQVPVPVLSSEEENGEELTDGVLNFMPVEEAQWPYTPSSVQHGRRDRNQTPISAPAGLDSMPAALNTQVPMNVFSTWEVECSSPTCLPRLCSLSLTKLLIYKKLEEELSAVVISVKMQGSKKILRSEEILLPPSCQGKIDLALTFCLQYPHSLKREVKQLQILLQQKLPLNNQTIPGYRTLAMGTISMAEAMQRPLEGGRMLSLHSTIPEAAAHVAEVSIASLSSQPIDPEDSTQRAGPKAKSRVHYSEMEYEIFSDQQGSYDPGHWQDQEEEEDLGFEEPKKQRQRGGRSPLTPREQDANDKVRGWLRRVQEWQEVLDSEQGSSENVFEVEDLDRPYDSIQNSASGP